MSTFYLSLRVQEVQHVTIEATDFDDAVRKALKYIGDEGAEHDFVTRKAHGWNERPRLVSITAKEEAE